jgi:hypothetical protein
VGADAVQFAAAVSAQLQRQIVNQRGFRRVGGAGVDQDFKCLSDSRLWAWASGAGGRWTRQRMVMGSSSTTLKPGLFQDALDEFWLLRHRAVHVLLDHQADTDALLHDLTKHR